MFERKWNSKRPLIFTRVVLTRTVGAHKTREIWARIYCLLGLWERGIHAGLVVGALADGRAREGRVERHK